MNLPIELKEYLKINIKQEGSINDIFEQLLKYLDEFKLSRYLYEFSIPLQGIVNKFENCAEYLGADPSKLKEITQELVLTTNEFSDYLPSKNRSVIYRLFFRKLENKRRILRGNDGLKKADLLFQEIYSQIISIYNEVQDAEPIGNPIELNGFYKPENSNKQKARHLIVDAINIIENDSSLSEKSKKSIIDYLNKALAEFDKQNSNWTSIFGGLKETIFVLGALGSLAGGIVGTVALTQAKEKLEEATEIIQTSSININYQNVNQIFNIGNDNDIALIHNQPKILLEDKVNKTVEAKELN